MPNYNETTTFNEYTLYQDNLLLKHSVQSYTSQKLQMEIVSAKLSKSRDYLVIQSLLPYNLPISSIIIYCIYS